MFGIVNQPAVCVTKINFLSIQIKALMDALPIIIIIYIYKCSLLLKMFF